MTSSTPESPATSAWGIALTTLGADGSVLDAWYPSPQLGEAPSELSQHPLHAQLSAAARSDEARGTTQEVVVRTIDLAAAPADAADAYLRLHLLSHRLVRPLELNMDGSLRRLSTVVWTNKGPCTPDNFEFVRTALRSRGLIHVYGIEKLPRMVDYVVPSGVNIAEAERVRLGAYLAPGTRVLREGYVSFNSGSLGAARIEGRLSSSTVIGEGTDVGLSSTVMARRRSDGLRDPITIGANCTFGVSSGAIGLNIGDNCTLGSNIVLEADTQVWDADANHHVAASSLNGQSNWSVRREVGHAEPVLRRVWQ